MWNAWLIYDKEGAKRNEDYIRYHMDVGEKMNIKISLVLEDELQFPLPEKPDFAIVRTIRPKLSKQLEREGIRIFNNAMVAEICNDKGKTIAYVKEHTKVPTLPFMRFFGRDLTEELLHQYPHHVIKSVDGHGGKQVFRTEDEFDDIKREIRNSDFVIQPFQKGQGKDVRVYVIGDEIIGAVERESQDGFKANFSLGGTVKNYPLSEKEKSQIQDITNVFSFGMVGIDFLLDEKGNFVFNEIEDVVGARMLFQCQPDIKLLERYFSFIIDKMLHYH